MSVSSTIRRRIPPYFVMIDTEFRIVHYETAALELLEELCGAAAAGRLPNSVEISVRNAIAHATDEESPGHASVMPVPSLLVHVRRIRGGSGTFYVLLLQRESHRATLASAARKFALTKREREVLQLVMRGMHASDIAEQLSISHATVTGYFKGLLRKTQARNRSEMVAKVLGWDDIDALPASV